MSRTSDRLQRYLEAELNLLSALASETRYTLVRPLVETRKDGRRKRYRSTSRTVALVTVLEGCVDGA